MLLGEWLEDESVYWYGGNGNEYIAWKGSHQVFVYPCDDYPNPPSYIIQHTERIETLEDFNDALNSGKIMNVEYKLD